MNSRATLIALTALALPMLVSGCGEVDDRPPTFTYVYETVIAHNCATIGCHSSWRQTSGLQFNTKTSAYVGLTGTACNDADDQEANNFVVAGRPDASQMVQLLKGDRVARRMPPDRGISSVDIALVEDWILEGALCD